MKKERIGVSSGMIFLREFISIYFENIEKEKRKGEF